MSSFRISFSKDAFEDLSSLDSSVARAVRRIIDTKLSIDPEAFGKPLRHALAGTRSVRAGDWRVTYIVQGQDVHITRVFHRSHGYER